MKKAVCVFVSVILAFSLSACVTITKDIDFLQERENIRSIEIYNSELAYSERNIHFFRNENEPIALLSDEAINEFLDDVEKMSFEEVKLLFPIPMDGGCDYQGYIVIIVYTDGSYDILAQNGQYSCAMTANGEPKYHRYDYSDYCGDKPWPDLIEKYINSKETNHVFF